MEEDHLILKSSLADLEWLRQNAQLIRDKFEGQIIAIKDGSVVASAPTADVLFGKLRSMGVQESDVIVKYVSLLNEITIL